MKKLSVFQISLLAGFGAFAVAGVLIFALAVGGGNSTSLGPVQIWGTLDGGAFSAALRQIAESDPSLAQVTYVQKDPATFDADITKALAAGNGPDLILLQQGYAFKDRAELAVIPETAVSRSQFTSTFIQAADPFFSAQGALAIPLITDPLVLYWNKDLLATGGVSRPPAYWDQLLSIAPKVSVVDSSGTISKSTISFGEFRNVDHAKDVLVTLIMQAGGSVTGLDTAGRLQSTLVPKSGSDAGASQSALAFFTEFADPSKADYSWNRALPEAAQAFAAGDLALYVGYASEANSIARSNPNLSFGMAALPQVRSATTMITYGSVWGLAAARAGKNPSAAITAAAALATSANSQLFSTALGYPSARRDVLSSAATKSIPGQLASADDLCKGVDPVICSAQVSRAWIDPDPEATDSIFQAMIEQTTSGAALAGQALQRADQQLTQLLSSQQGQ